MTGWGLSKAAQMGPKDAQCGRGPWSRGWRRRLQGGSGCSALSACWWPPQADTQQVTAPGMGWEAEEAPLQRLAECPTLFHLSRWGTTRHYWANVAVAVRPTALLVPTNRFINGRPSALPSLNPIGLGTSSVLGGGCLLFAREGDTAQQRFETLRAATWQTWLAQLTD